MARFPLRRVARSLGRVLDVGLTYGPLVRGRGDPSSSFDADSWWHAMNTPAGAVTLRVRGGDVPGLDVWGPGRVWAIERAGDLTGAADDPAVFTPGNPFVAELHRQLPGLRWCACAPHSTSRSARFSNSE